MRAYTASNIGYDVERYTLLVNNGCAPDMDDDMDMFVNGNFPNVRDIPGADEAAVEANFTAAFEYDEVNDDGVPVIVYLKAGQLVAWVDLENGWGYVAG